MLILATLIAPPVHRPLTVHMHVHAMEWSGVEWSGCYRTEELSTRALNESPPRLVKKHCRVNSNVIDQIACLTASVARFIIQATYLSMK
jgi:hypothetical protein